MSDDNKDLDLSDGEVHRAQSEALRWHIDKLYADIHERYEGEMGVLTNRVQALENFFLTSERKVRETIAYWDEKLKRVNEQAEATLDDYKEAEKRLEDLLHGIDPRYLDKVKEIVEVLEVISRWGY